MEKGWGSLVRGVGAPWSIRWALAMVRLLIFSIFIQNALGDVPLDRGDPEDQELGVGAARGAGFEGPSEGEGHGLPRGFRTSALGVHAAARLRQRLRQPQFWPSQGHCRACDLDRLTVSPLTVSQLTVSKQDTLVS